MAYKVLTYGTRDANEKWLSLLASLLGNILQKMPAGIGYDDVLFCPNGPHIVEIKSSDEAELTKPEKKRKIEIEATGVKYNIIITCRELMTLMGIRLEDLPLNELWLIGDAKTGMGQYADKPDVHALLTDVGQVIAEKNASQFNEV